MRFIKNKNIIDYYIFFQDRYSGCSSNEYFLSLLHSTLLLLLQGFPMMSDLGGNTFRGGTKEPAATREYSPITASSKIIEPIPTKNIIFNCTCMNNGTMAYCYIVSNMSRHISVYMNDCIILNIRIM